MNIKQMLEVAGMPRGQFDSLRYRGKLTFLELGKSPGQSGYRLCHAVGLTAFKRISDALGPCLAEKMIRAHWALLVAADFKISAARRLELRYQSGCIGIHVDLVKLFHEEMKPLLREPVDELELAAAA